MSSPTVPPRFAAVPGRGLAALAVAAAALVAAFVAAPPALLGGVFVDEHRLADAFRRAFVGYWRSGGPGFPADLDRIVADWFQYHLVKAAVAAILLVVAGALAVLLGKAFVRSGGALRALSGVVATALALVSLAAVMANAQGLVTPFGSLFPTLIGGPTGGELAAALEQARQGLAGSPGAGEPTPPALQVMINEFSRYHVAMAVIAPIVAVVLLAASVILWRGFAATASSDRRARRVLGSYGVLTVSLAAAAIVLAVANVGVAADPAPALLALLEGGW